jgi:peptidyl-prolyl cis-trans isomerase B (cyclophilin B)
LRKQPDVSPVGMKFSIVGLLLLSSALLAAEQKPAASNANAANEVAIIQTSEGDIVVQFWTDAAPKTIENFKKLARSGFYNGTTFHRVMKGFMIQGGDPYTKDPAKEKQYGDGGPGYKIKDEFNHHDHQRGVVSMAREKDPDSAGSQFFICLASVPRLDGKYTTFGKLIRGDEVLTKIGNTPVKKNPAGEMSQPLNRVVIRTIKIVPANSVR